METRNSAESINTNRISLRPKNITQHQVDVCFQSPTGFFVFTLLGSNMRGTKTCNQSCENRSCINHHYANYAYKMCGSVIGKSNARAVSDGCWALPASRHIYIESTTYYFCKNHGNEYFERTCCVCAAYCRNFYTHKDKQYCYEGIRNCFYAQWLKGERPSYVNKITRTYTQKGGAYVYDPDLFVAHPYEYVITKMLLKHKLHAYINLSYMKDNAFSCLYGYAICEALDKPIDDRQPDALVKILGVACLDDFSSINLSFFDDEWLAHKCPINELINEAQIVFIGNQ